MSTDDSLSLVQHMALPCHEGIVAQSRGIAPSRGVQYRSIHYETLEGHLKKDCFPGCGRSALSRLFCAVWSLPRIIDDDDDDAATADRRYKVPCVLGRRGALLSHGAVFAIQ